MQWLIEFSHDALTMTNLLNPTSRFKVGVIQSILIGELGSS